MASHREDSYFFHEDISDKLEFLIENSVFLNQHKLQLYNEDEVRLMDSDQEVGIDALKEQLEDAKNTLSRATTAINEVDDVVLTSEAFNTRNEKISEKLSDNIEKLKSLSDSLEPLLILKASGDRSSIPEIHVDEEKLRAYHEMITSVSSLLKRSQEVQASFDRIRNGNEKRTR